MRAYFEGRGLFGPARDLVEPFECFIVSLDSVHGLVCGASEEA